MVVNLKCKTCGVELTGQQIGVDPTNIYIQLCTRCFGMEVEKRSILEKALGEILTEARVAEDAGDFIKGLLEKYGDMV